MGNTFYGVFCTTWIHCQNESRPNNPNGSALLTAIIKTRFAAVINRWDTRNQHLHRQQEQSTKLHQRAASKVRALYACKPHVLPSNCPIFSTPLQQLLLKPTKMLQLFIDQNHSIVKQSMQQYQLLNMRQHRDIHTYFIANNQPSHTMHKRVTSGKECHQ